MFHHIHITEQTTATKTFVFFPPAGSIAASNHKWTPFIPSHTNAISIEYPGRGVAIQEKNSPSFDLLTEKIAHSLLSYPLGDFYFIGESFGGFVAFEVAKSITKKCNLTLEKLLLISVAEWETNKRNLQKLTFLTNAIFEEELRKNIFQNNFHINHILSAKEYFLPLIRQDMLLLQNSNICFEDRISASLMVANGTQDAFCHSLLSKEFWQKQIKGRYQYYTYDGCHIPNHQQMQIIMNEFINF